MISTIIIIGIILTAGIAFNMQSRRAVARLRHRQNLSDSTLMGNSEADKEDNLIIEPVSTDKTEREIMRTIDLIGHNAYVAMTKRIDEITKRHASHQCATVSLTCGPDTLDGAHELHRLLPGQPVKLVSCRAGGVDTIDLYFNGVRIGRLALNEASLISSIMEDNSIVAAYVAEQNCFGIIGSHQMDIIVFFEPRKQKRRLADILMPTFNAIRSKHGATKNICLN